MATKRKTAAEIREEEIVKAEAEMMDENSEEETEPTEIDDKDAEIAQLKAQLAQLKKETVAEVFIPNGRGDMERIQRLATQIAEAGEDPWKVLVKVRVPRKMGAGDDDFWIVVNGVSAQIPANGEVQEMKLPFAMQLMEALEAEEKAIEFAEGLQVYDPLTNPKPRG